MSHFNCPHFTHPFGRDHNGQVGVAEQGTEAHIQTQINSVVVTPLGFRPERPDFGWPFPEFEPVPVDLTMLRAAIRNFVPDADVQVQEWADVASQAIRHIRIEERV